jgi:hypothetical protein
MHLIKHMIAAAASFCLIGPAMAAEMTGAELKDFNSGKTLYSETTAASAGGTQGQAILYFDPDGTVLYKSQKGIMHGTWTIKGNTLCNDWKEAPNTGCRKYDKQGDTINVTNAENGQAVAKIVKTAPGNAENLKP